MKFLDKINKEQLLLNFIFALLLLYILWSTGIEINRDGSGYLAQAKLISLGEIEKAKNLYPDLFFSSFIYFISDFFFLTFINSVKFFNFVCLFFIFFYFQLILKLIFPNQPRIFLSGFLAFISASMLLDTYATMILRDHGAWLGMIAGLYYFLEWINKRKFKYLLLFFLCIVFAFFFRNEFIVILLLPLFQIKSISKFRYKHSFIVIFIAVFCVFLLTYFLSNSALDLNLSRLLVFFERLSFIYKPLPINTDDIWLNNIILDFPLLFKYGSLSFIFFFKVMNIVGIVYAVILLITINKKIITENTKYVIYLLVILLILPMINLFSVYVVSGRYFIGPYLLMLLFVSYGLSELISGSVKNLLYLKYKVLINFFITFLLLISFFDVIINSNKKSNELILSEWISDNKIKEENIYIKNMRLRYYLDFYPIEEVGLNEAIDLKYDYIVLDVDKNFYELVNYHELIINKNNNSKIKVFKRKS